MQMLLAHLIKASFESFMVTCQFGSTFSFPQGKGKLHLKKIQWFRVGCFQMKTLLRLLKTYKIEKSHILKSSN